MTLSVGFLGAREAPDGLDGRVVVGGTVSCIEPQVTVRCRPKESLLDFQECSSELR